MIDNIIFFCLEIVFAITIFLILLIEILDSVTEQQRYTYIGYTIILLLALMIVTRMLLTVASVVFMGYKAILGKKVEDDPLTKFRKAVSMKIKEKRYKLPITVEEGPADKPHTKMAIDKLIAHKRRDKIRDTMISTKTDGLFSLK